MRSAKQEDIDLSIEALLADPVYAGHPLRAALDELYKEFRGVLYQIERISRISDHYQAASREETLTLTQRYRKQLRLLERTTRISDHYQAMMRDRNQELKLASMRDALTGIGNRRMLTDSLKAETARSDRTGRPLTLALIDVDRFKAVNDAYGHEAGDKALVEIAQTIQSNVRDYDFCGRWGGEEFMVIMPEIGAEDGAVVIERVRNAILALEITVGDASIRLSASFGIAQRNPGESIAASIKRADSALFRAKSSGRNRYEISS